VTVPWIAVAVGALLLAASLLSRHSPSLRWTCVVSGGVLLLAAGYGFVVAEARYDQCEDDRGISRVGDLITCRRTFTGATRTGGVLVRRPVPNAPAGPAITLESPAFPYAGTLPPSAGCRGANQPPPLRWQRVPARTEAQAILLVEGFRRGVVRWIVTDLPPNARRLEGDGSNAGHVLRNSLGKRGYSGPCDLPGDLVAGVEAVVGMTFRVYALDRALRLDADASLDEAFDAINAAAIADGELSGGYDPELEEGERSG
jgi:phosphatidylethanolamine-binding protein (PEBP) family uncharacterized protein